MDKIIKLNSIEGGPFTAQQNRISFQIPNDGVYDLSESYINLNFRVNAVDANITDGIGIYPVDIRWKPIDGTASPGVNPNFPNVCLIKNARMATAMQGQVENIRRVDQLKSLMSTYTQSVEEEYSRSYKACSQIVQPRNGALNRWSLYQEINKTGAVPSRVNDNARVMIPLGDIFDFCYQADEFDAQKAGTTTINCELNVDKLIAAESQVAFGTLNEFEDIPTDGNQLTLTTKIQWTNLEQSPYYVGQKIQIDGTTAGAPYTAQRVISSIVWNDTTGKLELSSLTPWIIIASGQSFTGITSTKVAPASTSLDLNFGEIVLTQKPMNKSSVSSIEYSTFSTEQTNGNNLVPLQRQFQVEGESDAVIIAFPQGEDELISSKNLTAITEYRLRLDNEDLTDRSIAVPSPLYYDRINMTLIQMATRLKRLTEVAGDNASPDPIISVSADTEILSIMSPLVQKPREKLLQVNTDGSGVNAMVLYKHLPRVFSY